MTSHAFRRMTLGLLILFAAPAAAQTASVTYWGKSCNGSIYIHYKPRLGETIIVGTTGSHSYISSHNTIFSYQPVLMLGLSKTTWAGINLPWALPYGAVLKPYTCHLLVAPDYLAYMGFKNVFGYHNEWYVGIPNDKSLLGMKIHGQWAIKITEGSYPDKLVYRIETSNAATVVIGN